MQEAINKNTAMAAGIQTIINKIASLTDKEVTITYKEVTVKDDGYERKAYFKDKDKNEYYVLFYKLTNGVDIKIADYKKNKDGKWELIYINPEKCLENKNNL